MSDNTIRSAVYGMPYVELEGIVSGGPVLPGMILQLMPDNTWAPHSSASGFCSEHIAYESWVNGADLNTPYQVGDRVYIIKGRDGDVFNLLLAPGESVDIGDLALSNGDGYVRGIPPPPLADEAVVGIFFEAVSSTDLYTRVKVEIT